MTDFLRLAVIFLAAVNPPAVVLSVPAASRPPVNRMVVAAGALGALGLLALAALFATPVLEFLDIAPESFRLAAGVVLATAGAVIACLGRLPIGDDEAPGPVRVVVALAGVIAGPAALTATVSYSADEGAALTSGAAAVAAVVPLALLMLGGAKSRPALLWSARVLGALLVAIAAGLATSGVRAI